MGVVWLVLEVRGCLVAQRAVGAHAVVVFFSAVEKIVSGGGAGGVAASTPAAPLFHTARSRDCGIHWLARAV